jgi:hypothetical protein
MRDILEAVHRHQQVMAAAKEIGCSDAYIHVRMKMVGLTLHGVLEAENLSNLLDGIE